MSSGVQCSRTFTFPEPSFLLARTCPMKQHNRSRFRREKRTNYSVVHVVFKKFASFVEMLAIPERKGVLLDQIKPTPAVTRRP